MSQNASFFDTLKVLSIKGIRYSTVIDIGCADGQFILSLFASGLIADAIPLNIDANPIYEESLTTIKNAIGGHFRISAVTDNNGAIEITQAVHPYWSSVRP